VLERAGAVLMARDEDKREQHANEVLAEMGRLHIEKES
jgi:hypothetical protein